MRYKKGQIPWNKGEYTTTNFSRSSSNSNSIERNFYQIWVGMRNRCLKTNKKNNKSYFDKGIKVCERWQDFTFFFIDMFDSYLLHRKINKDDTQIDRINNDKGYYKNNCHWVTARENNINRGNIKKLRGKTFKEWEEILGIKEQTLRSRHDVLKWSDDKILLTKTGNQHGKNI
jgi:hypothetical protein